MGRGNRRGAAAVLCILAAIALPCGAHAQEAAGPSTGQTQCFFVNRVVLEGAVPQLAFLKKDAQSVSGGCVGVPQINGVVAMLTAALVRAGFVTTRIRVPQQNLSSGELRLIVVPGYIHSVRYAHPSNVSWKNAYPVRSGRLLNVRDLEQGLEQMKRVPSQDVEMAIAPVMESFSDVVLEVHHARAWHVDIDMNDAGSDRTGKMQGSFTFSYDNPLRANDLFHVGLNTAVQGGVAGASRGDSAYYSLPFGYWTVELNASRYRYSQVIQGRDAAYTLAGTTHAVSVTAQRLLYRSQRVKTDVSFTLSASSGRNFLNDTELDVQRRAETYGEVKLHRNAGDGKSSLDVTTGLRLGMPLFATLADVPQAPGDPTYFYSMAFVDASASVPVKGTSFRWQPELHAQFTGDRLYPNDMLSIGNRYTVRGFDGVSSIASESGFYLRNDFVSPLNRHASFYVGADTGALWGQSASMLAGTALTGLVTGVRGRYGHLSFDTFSGIAIHAPRGFVTAQPAGGIDLQLQL